MGKGEEYRKRRKEYKELCERKKREENERWEKRAVEARREKEVWEIENRERNRRKRINEGIELKEHFMRLLGGVQRRVIRERGGKRKGRHGIEEDIRR